MLSLTDCVADAFVGGLGNGVHYSFSLGALEVIAFDAVVEVFDLSHWGELGADVDFGALDRVVWGVMRNQLLERAELRLDISLALLLGGIGLVEGLEDVFGLVLESGLFLLRALSWFLGDEGGA